MASSRKTEDKQKTRELILDATEQIMREEGYAAVSSRRIASKAGLKSQLVHYHFGTMDELFLALYQRVDAQGFERHLSAMTSSNPLRALWAMSIDRSDMGLIFEFMALANHRNSIRAEISRSNVRRRAMQVAMLTKALDESGIPPDICPANVLSVLLAGTALQLVTEHSIGATEAHADTVAFVERLLAMAEQRKIANHQG